MDPYRVYQVSDSGTPDASTLVVREMAREQMGSKEKLHNLHELKRAP